MFRSRMRANPVIDDDPSGLQRAVYDFNEHIGPARIFFHRDTRTYHVRTYEPGGERWWEPTLYKGPDEVELQRKTTPTGKDRVEDYELRGMAEMLGPYVKW